jgi:CubicO group peptidase (beta-lactamase class C family)
MTPNKPRRLPELAEPRVLRRLDSEFDDTVPADRPITYNTGASVAGVLIERVVGRSLGDVPAERIVSPLGRTDTGFYVTADQRDRFRDVLRPWRPARRTAGARPARRLVFVVTEVAGRRWLAGVDGRRPVGVRLDAGLGWRPPALGGIGACFGRIVCH